MIYRHIYRIATLLGMIFLTADQMTAQERVPITLNEAVEIARRNNTGLEKARLAVDYRKKLLDAGVRKPPSKLFLSGEEFDFQEASGIHSLNLQQNFYLPQVARARRGVDQSEVQLVESELALTDQELRMQVGKAYYRVLFTQHARALAEESQDLFERFLEVTTAQLESGETGKIPQLAAQSRVGSAELAIEHAHEQHELAVLVFNQWLRSDTLYYAQDSLPIPYESHVDTLLPANPHLAVRNAIVSRARAHVTEQESRLLPQIVSGVRLQTATGLFPMFGYEVGVEVPLFAKSYRRHVEAAELHVRVEETAVEATRQRIEREVNELRYRLEHITHILEYLEEVLAPVVNEQSAVNLLAYQEGEIRYLEYLDSLEQELSIQQQYLEALYEFNLLHLELDYWLGK